MIVVIAFIHLVNTKQQYHNSLKLKSIIINLKNPKSLCLVKSLALIIIQCDIATDHA